MSEQPVEKPVLSSELYAAVEQIVSGELEEARHALAAATARLADAEKVLEDAEKAEAKAWRSYKPFEGKETVKAVEARERWEKTNRTLELAQAARGGSFDHHHRLERLVADLENPETVTRRLTNKKEADMARSKNSKGGRTTIQAILVVMHDNGPGKQMKLADMFDLVKAAAGGLTGPNWKQTVYSVIYSEAKKPTARVTQVAKGTFKLTAAGKQAAEELASGAAPAKASAPAAAKASADGKAPEKTQARPDPKPASKKTGGRKAAAATA